jgi:soluble lytic murein transglycosylase-like protein
VIPLVEALVLRWVKANPGKAALIAGLAISPFILLPFMSLVTFLIILDPQAFDAVANMPLPGDWNGPVAIKPGVIPAKYLPDLQHAAMAERVPLQLLAGEAETESSFNPNATNYAPGTHATGMFQFEPASWSGWANPYSNDSKFDTNPSRIRQYGGYGVDANGDGSASPFDPADAAMAAATYLRQLYNQYGHHWSLACFWYGSETQAYVNTVFGYTEGFIATTPPEKAGNGYWFLGGTNSKLSQNNGNTITLSAPAWEPIIAPVDGTLSIQYGGSGDSISLDTGAGTLKFSGGVVAWANNGSDVRAGSVIGFTTGNINVTGPENPLQMLGISTPKWA